MKNEFRVVRLLLGLALALLATTPMSRGQSAANLTTLHTFTESASGAPVAPLVQGVDGSFYGVGGGSNTRASTVFKITPDGTFTVLHTFTGGNNPDFPAAALILGQDGSFYGTTVRGGTNPNGSVFRITPAGTFTTLHSFTGSHDGFSPYGSLIQNADGNLYGTTSGGGTGNVGTVFGLTPTGVFTTLYTFTGKGDGGYPFAGLLRGTDGNFYGTTTRGATAAYGTIYRITPAGVLTTLHTFTGSDGSDPHASLIQGSDGNLYGTATGFATGAYGSVFTITPAGAFTTLYTFTGGHDGGTPEGGLVQGTDGNFYGTTAGQDYLGPNSYGAGTVFSMTPAGVLTTLHIFNDYSGGDTPKAALVQAGDGSFYGTTSGAISYFGTVFRLTTGTHPDFFSGEVPLSNGVYYLSFPNGTLFGYYSYLSDPNYIYHFDLGYEYVFDPVDAESGVYLYDFASQTFFYTSPIYPFPYLYDFTLDAVLYYYPDPDRPGHYNTNGVRYFYNYGTGRIITK